MCAAQTKRTTAIAFMQKNAITAAKGEKIMKHDYKWINVCIYRKNERVHEQSRASHSLTVIETPNLQFKFFGGLKFHSPLSKGLGILKPSM